MKIATITALNDLNKLFYETVGNEFDRTRQQYWEGWDTFLPTLKNLVNQKRSIKVLDVACGNSRFGRFLNESLPEAEINYTGLDREPQLIQLSEQALKATNLTYKLTEIDIVQNLIDNTFIEKLSENYDLIVIFGLLHHIPSKNLRDRLIANSNNKLNKNGLLILSSWQFAKLPRFSERFIDPKKLSIDPNELEPHDHILDWHRVHTAYRYCHFADEVELRELVEVNTNLKIKHSFYADGKNHQLNFYVVADK